MRASLQKILVISFLASLTLSPSTVLADDNGHHHDGGGGSHDPQTSQGASPGSSWNQSAPAPPSVNQGSAGRISGPNRANATGPARSPATRAAAATTDVTPAANSPADFVKVFAASEISKSPAWAQPMSTPSAYGAVGLSAQTAKQLYLVASILALIGLGSVSYVLIQNWARSRTNNQKSGRLHPAQM